MLVNLPAWAACRGGGAWAHGELGVLRGPGSLHGREAPLLQAALLGSVGLGAAVPTPVTERWADRVAE